MIVQMWRSQLEGWLVLVDQINRLKVEEVDEEG